MEKLNVPREVMHKFWEYQNLVLKWNDKINLVSRSETTNFFDRHLKDCLQLKNYIDNLDIHLIDVGSGAGLPGLILSIAGVKKVTLIEPNYKKAAFLLQAAGISSNEVTIINDTAQNVKALKCDILTSRAFCSVKKILQLTNNILIQDKYLLLKGRDILAEIEGAKKTYDFGYKIYNSLIFSKAKVLEIYK